MQNNLFFQIKPSINANFGEISKINNTPPERSIINVEPIENKNIQMGRRTSLTFFSLKLSGSGRDIDCNCGK